MHSICMMQNSDPVGGIEGRVRMGGRQLEFDIAKGIAILCVILGHLDVTLLQHLVFLFHMPIFFLISGYFLSTRRPMGEFVRKKARGLLVPYYFTGLLICLCSIPMSLAGGQDWLANAGRWLGGVLYGAPAIWQVPFLWPEFPSFIGALWFLLALFWASLFVRLALALPRRWMTAVLVVGAAVIAWASAQRLFLPRHPAGAHGGRLRPRGRLAAAEQLSPASCARVCCSRGARALGLVPHALSRFLSCRRYFQRRPA